MIRTLMAESLCLSIVILLLLVMRTSSSDDEQCRESSCGPHQPLIKFPFRLVQGSEGRHRCPDPLFCLDCNENSETTVLLPTSSGPPIQFLVRFIYYEDQVIQLSDPQNCLPTKLLKLINSSSQPSRFRSVSETTLSFFNCSSVRRRHLRNYYQMSDLNSPQDMISCPIYASGYDQSLLKLDLTSCTKMFDVVTALVDSYFLPFNLLSMTWSKQNYCADCEAKGKRCRWKSNSTEGETECFHCIRKSIQIPRSFIFSAAGSILSGLVLILAFKIHCYYREKKEDQTRVEKFLEDYSADKPARFSYADIKRITNGFKEKLGEGAHGTVFQGKLSNEILVAVKKLNNNNSNTAGEEGKEFITEVEIMGKIHHINIARLLGYCAEGVHRALIYNLFPNGSLQNFIFPPDEKDHFLGWKKMQHISLGIAKGIEYLHHGCNHPILHFDINPHNVLLDDNFTPKITDFGLAKLCSKNVSAVSMTAARGTLGYMAPEVFSRNFGNVSLKSDVYSYGMLLLEMVGGRKNVDTTSSTETFQVLYPEWIHKLLEGDIHINIEDDCDLKIAKKLAIVGLWCIQWQPVNRPSIKAVIHMLESREEDHLTVPPNPFHSTQRPLHLEAIHE